MKFIGYSKLAWHGVLTFVISLLAFLQGQELVAQYPEVVTALGMIAGILTVILRTVTNQPVSFK